LTRKGRSQVSSSKKKKSKKTRLWPVEGGRYRVGNPCSPIAICTEATISGIKVNLEKVAVIGKCVTENVGVERIVKNIIANPRIRFLLVCGKVSKGHAVGQTILALKKNGVDQKMRVIGSQGAIPLLKHLTLQEIDRFRKQVMVVDFQGVTNSQKIQFKIEELWRKDPGKFAGQPLKMVKTKKQKVKPVKAIKAEEKYVTDPKGSFQITIDKEKGVIIAAHYNPDFEMDTKIVGKTAHEITDTIIKRVLIGDFAEAKDHAAYLGRELAKAEICLKNGLDYVQDEPVVLKKEKKQAEDEFGFFD
jgi:tetrahydromethanopterin S-methyltransferase subunit A